MADKSVTPTQTTAPAKYEAMNGQEAKAAQIVAEARTTDGSAAAYKSSVAGTEDAAKSIVDAARDSANATAQKVAGKGGDFNGMDIMDAQSLNNVETASGRPMQSANGQNGVSMNATNMGGTDIATAHTLNKPVAGQTTTINVQPGEILATTFDPNGANLTLQGKNLVMEFQDGGKIVLSQFAADADNMPTIALPNGALVAGGVVIAQLQGTNEDIFSLETAAGGAAGGGNFIYDDNLGSVINLLSKLPPIPFTELLFPQPNPEVVLNDNDLVGGDFTPEFLTPSGDIVVSGGYEDWQPNQHTGDLTVTPMNLQLTFTPDDNEVVDVVTISDIPAGVKFFFGGTDAAHEVPVINGSVAFTGAQIASGDIFVLPVGNTDGDLPMTISMLIRDPDNGRTAVITKPAVAIVDAVADLPIVSVAISATGKLHDVINLNLDIKFNDNDGSELHTITLKGVPSEWTLNTTPGVMFAHDPVSGDYTVTAPANVLKTLSFDPHNWGDKTVTGGSTTANLTLITRTEETKLDGELRTDNNVAEIQTPLTVTIKDDLPTLKINTESVTLLEHNLEATGVTTTTGTITVNFFGDNPGTVKFTGVQDAMNALHLKSHNVELTYAVSNDGKTIIGSANGVEVLKITLSNPVGAGNEKTVTYTVTLSEPLDHVSPQDGSLISFPIKVIATDSNNDSIGGQFTVGIIDDTPTTTGNNSTTDETNQLGNTLNGTITQNFHADGAGSIAGTGTFTSSGSLQTQNVIKSGGEVVVVTLVGNQYVGKVGNDTVFTLTIGANGQYAFTQFKPLDHADGSNANDVINLNFGYKVTDFDGDVATSTITIKVVDDAPIANDDIATIPDGSNVATGNVVVENDDISTDVTNLVSEVSYNGTTKTFAADGQTDAGGKFVEIDGDFGTLKLYEDGEYTYTYDATAHGPNYDRFDLPANALPFPVLTEGQDVGDLYNDAQQQILIDTANAMTIDFPTVVNIELQKSTIDVGSYNNSLGAFTLHSDGTISNVDIFFGNATADVTNPLVGTPAGKTSYAMNSADGKVVFFLLQNAFAELKTLGLADAQGRATDPTGSLHMVKQSDGSLKLVFTDNTGDHTLTSKVYTSEKEFNADGQFHTIAGLAPNTLDTAQFGFEDLTGSGPSGSDRDFNDVMFTVTVDERFTPGGKMEDKFTYTLKDSDGDTDKANLTIGITDNGPGNAPNIVQTIDESTDLNLVVGGTIVVEHAATYALGTPSGGGAFDMAGSLKGGVLSSNGVAITVSFVGGKYIGVAGNKEVFTLEISSNGQYSFVQKAVIDHNDGANANDIINLTFAYTARDADGDAVQGKILINIKDDAPTAVADVNNVPDGASTASGNVVTANDILSKDVSNTLKDASFGNTVKSFATADGTDAGGKYVLLNATYGTLKIYENGSYTYTLNNGNTGNHAEQFKYTLRDFDGDTSNTTLTISIVDNGPGAAPSVTKLVDETTDLNLAVGGTLVVTGATSFALGASNGAATFTSTGSKLGDALTSNGVAISVSLVGGKYVGVAGGKEIFTLELNNSGTYSFVQKAVIDHKDGSDINDIINLNFTYTARDADGDAVSNTITIQVRDDAPTAVADVNNIPDGASTASGNVVTSNDILSRDVANTLKDASFGGTTKSFATADGTDAGGKFVVLNAAYGTLKIYENGSYTYTLSNGNNGSHVEQFKYTLRDFDGDTSNTTLTISIVDNGPGAAPDVARTIDETSDINLSVGQTIVVAGATSFALGTVTGASAFTSGGSLLGDTLKSNGVAIAVTLENGQYVGRAGAKEIFTLTIGNNGTYNFVLKAPIDHKDASDINDIINLNFTYTARDADGDAVEGHIQINVKDDAPVAVADFNTVVDTIAVGNVITNDALSKDVINTLKDVSFGNSVKTFAADGLTDAGGKYVLVNGAEGQLKIYDNGTYTYTLGGGSTLPGNGGTKNDIFNYTLKDIDGDTSKTTLTLEAILPKMIVGKNVDDVSGSTTPYEVGTGTGVITGTSVNDLLVGDVGGSSVKAGVKDYNIVLVLDISGSMGDNNKLVLLKQAVDNLLADFNNYQGGEVRVHIVPFHANTATVATFTVTDNTQFNSAVSFVNALAVGTGNNAYTNYEAPLQSAISWLQGTGPIAGAEKFTYFVSDGEPNRYLNGTTVTEGTANTVMGEITGSDGTNEVAILQGLSEVVGVGIGVTATTIGRLSTIDSGTDSALDVKNPEDLNTALQGASPIQQLGAVGDDILNAGSGNDLIFGDTLNTDALAVLHGMTTPAGAGWKVFADLEAGGGWTRADTVAYIRSHTQELAGETTKSNGEGRDGGNDTINAGDGNDVIFGQEGNDTINAGAGNDILNGGSGNNVLTGGDGSDTFLFLKNAHGHDTITDFSNAQNDKLDISDLLVGSAYAPGISAVDDYVKIDHTTGQVFVDNTGHGTFNSATHIATINNISSLDTLNVILNDDEGSKIIHTI